ncbi:MAG: hypothetical protein EZS28_045769, partial [Streblomastix strix]|jgi:hypothetical protein
MAQT